MRVDRRPLQRVRIEMLPLIDIVFLLLVFFIYAMLSMAVHRGLPVTLPVSSTVNIDKQLILSVTVRDDGSVFVDKEPVTLTELSGVLKTRSENTDAPGVLLFGDRNLSYQKLFEVMDLIRKAGLTRISLQAERDSPEP
ncbi:Biopolymer transport protein ExbD/TolR [Olavius algarvensis associated proteobacterium Delta 3]|nr:Biopolymer transport protein ExbD/TolR [Olavius algarvensis associated proteobacterium Delta 3]CAB5164543.1 Biopolymer transport protein ExbD/TolR [Olavius algarvensis associated proteobacterium Delta 3]